MQSPLLESKPSREDITDHVNKYGYVNKDPTEASFLSNMFYYWAYRIVKLANLVPLKNEYLGKLTGSYTSRKYLKAFKEVWETKQYKKKKRLALIQAGFRANLMYVIFVFLCCIMRSLINIANVNLFRQYIRGFSTTPIPEDKRTFLDDFSHVQVGVMYLSIRLFEILVMRRASTYQRILGLKTGGELSTLVYDKLLKVSPSSMKDKAKTGEITNFIQVDAHRLQFLMLSSPDLFVMPFTIITYSYMLFKMLGNAFFVGLAAMFFSFGFNFVFSKKFKLLHKQQMKLKDARMKITTETFEHLKVLKLYAWEDEFLNRINQAREAEIENMEKKYRLSNITATFGMFSPVLISVSSIGAYQYWYSNLVIEDIFTSLSMFAALQFPLRMIPGIINNWFETSISMKRIEKYLNEEEIREQNIIRNDAATKANGIAVKIENGSYSWGAPVKEGSSYEDLEKKSKFKRPHDINQDRPKAAPSNYGPVELSTDVGRTSSSSDDNTDILDQSTSSSSSSSSRNSFMKGVKGPLIPPSSDIENNDPSSSSSSQTRIVLKDINLEIKKGEFVCIIGEVGSGKSSLLQAILNNLLPMSPNTKTIVNGEISYVSQIPWIQNATVRNNILFFQKYDEERYNKILELAELKPDLEILVGGDLTEIGEKGINLSGGQKARVCLARALYSDKDIYIFDDPISELDAHVGMNVMTNCIKGYLKDKTRILVTHALQYVSYADRIIYIKEGTIHWSGTYQEIKSQEFFNVFFEKMQTLNRKRSKEIEEKEQTKKDNKQINKGQIKRITRDEDKEEGSVSSNVYKSYIVLIGGWYIVLIVILLLISNQGLKGISDIWLGYWSTHQSKEKNNQYFSIYSSLSIGGCVFSYFLVLLQSKVAIGSSRKLHKDMILSLIRAPISTFHETIPKGQIFNRLSKEINNMDDWCSREFVGIITGCISLITCISVCAFYQPLCVLFIPILGVLGYKVAIFYVRCSREIRRMEGILRSPVLNVVNESIPGTITIRAFHYENQYRELFFDKIDDQTKISLISMGTSQWFDITLDFISFSFISFLMIFTMMFKERFASNSIGILLTYCINLQNGLVHALHVATGFENSMVSLERCLHYTKCPSELPQTTAIDATLQSWPSEGRIKFENYSVKYRPDTEVVLKNMNFSIKPHEKIGIAGRTGSGKSTISLCLFRLLEPLTGKIYIDDVDITTIGLSKLRSNLTIIPQDPSLMQGTLRYNIDPLKLYTDSELIDVLRRIDFEYIIKNHPDGLNQQIAEAGSNLSVGEKQLICIARAILRKSKIVIMDEATANIDYQTEETIQKAINEVLTNSTVLTIAHRIKTIINCDRVMTLDNGEIIDFDSPKTLLQNKKGLFYELYTRSTL